MTFPWFIAGASLVVALVARSPAFFPLSSLAPGRAGACGAAPAIKR